jgi:hypothetical protein
MRGAGLALAIALATLLGCSEVAPPPPLWIANGTTLTVSLLVNGRLVAEAKPGGVATEIAAAKLPPLPWRVEARSPSGRLLTSMSVERGQVAQAVGTGGLTATRGRVGQVDLSCGRLTIWSGDVQPSGPAPPIPPGMPGDCEP